MNTYLIPMNEGTGPYIKKIVANSEQTAKEKLYKQLYDKYEFVEGDTLDEIQAISQQNTVNTKRSKLDGYNLLYSLLVQDVTDEFLRRFKKLFLQVVAPEKPLWYKESDIYE